MRYLPVLAWPLGLALIICAGYLLARAAPAIQAAAGGPASRGRSRSRSRSHRTAGSGQLWAAAIGSGQFVIMAAIGAVLVFGVMALLGLAVVYHGLVIDKPIWSWLQHHQVHALAAAMKRLTKIGNTWTTWGAGAAAAVCLAVTWRARRWLPPAAVATAIVADHYSTLALRHAFHRLGPPTSPLGTYPSGGCDRVVVFYGLIAYLLWREFSGQRRTAIWAATAIGALAFTEAFSRVYLGLHWFTDALSGVLYGGLLLTVFITAAELVTGRVTLPVARRQAGGRARRPAAAAADACIPGGSSA